MEYLLVFALSIFISGLLIVVYQATHHRFPESPKE